MILIEKIKRVIERPSRLLIGIQLRWAHFVGNKKLLIESLYRLEMGVKPNLKDPKTFTEKIQWLKLNDHNPIYHKMVDKYEAKRFVSERVGEKYIIPTLGVWDNFEEIDFNSLPDKFVLKTTNGGGNSGVVICTDKSSFNKELAKIKLGKSMANDIYEAMGEWAYKDVPKRIIAEKFMAPEKSPAPKDIPDYKFFCFNGVPKYCQVIRDRHTKETIDFYDMDWNHMPFVGLNPVARPKNLDEMKDICLKLADSKPFVRVDLYVIDNESYFSELMLYPASGIGEDWNGKFGDLLTLPNATKVGKYLIDKGLITELKPEFDDLKDYKFFCFNGKPLFYFIASDRNNSSNDMPIFDFYSLDGDLLPFNNKGYRSSKVKHIEIPQMNEMISVASELASNIPFLRVDFYLIKDKVYFGETTFYHDSGFVPFEPQEWDAKIGQLLQLPNMGGGK